MSVGNDACRQLIAEPWRTRGGPAPRGWLSNCALRPDAVVLNYAAILRSQRKCDATPAQTDRCSAYRMPKSRQVPSTIPEIAG